MNFTDIESRIGLVSKGHFEQLYNAQLGSDEDMIALCPSVTNETNDRRQVKNGVDNIPKDLAREEVIYVPLDAGYFSGELIAKTEEVHPDVKILCATKKQKHGKTIQQLFEVLPEEFPKEDKEDEKKQEMTPAKMRKRLKTKPGQEIYGKRK